MLNELNRLFLKRQLLRTELNLASDNVPDTLYDLLMINRFNDCSSSGCMLFLRRGNRLVETPFLSVMHSYSRAGEYETRDVEQIFFHSLRLCKSNK